MSIGAPVGGRSCPRRPGHGTGESKPPALADTCCPQAFPHWTHDRQQRAQPPDRHPSAQLDDLHTRLDLTRWPDELPDAGWAYGTSLPYLRDLATYWRGTYDWREHEGALNTLRADGLRVVVSGFNSGAQHTAATRDPRAHHGSAEGDRRQRAMEVARLTARRQKRSAHGWSQICFTARTRNSRPATASMPLLTMPLRHSRGVREELRSQRRVAARNGRKAAPRTP